MGQRTDATSPPVAASPGPLVPLRAVVSIAALVAGLVVTPLAGQEWRGNARLSGEILDDAGRPLAGAELSLCWGEVETGLSATTGDDGRWTFGSLAEGVWRVKVAISGFFPTEGVTRLGAGRSSVPMTFRLRPLTEELPLVTAGNPQTIRAWLDKGDALMAERQWAAARAEYEKALGALPLPERPIILQGIARTHFLEGDVDRAVDTLEQALLMAPTDAELQQIYRVLMDRVGRSAAKDEFLAGLPAKAAEAAEAAEAAGPASPGIALPPAQQAVLDQPADRPRNGRTGDRKVAFEMRSPRSTLDEYVRRTGLPRDGILATDPDALAYDIAAESFQLAVPEAYEADGSWGLFVFVSPDPFGGSGPKTLAALADRKLIWVGAHHAGNARARWDRWGLALDAVANVRQLYDLDPQRIYISGYSGGGRVASGLALHFGDVFRGGLSLHGVDYFRPLSVPDRPGYTWNAGLARPGTAELRRLRRAMRYVIVTGERDFNRQQCRVTYEAMVEDGFEHVVYIEMPGADHSTWLTGPWLERALDGLDGAGL